MAVLPDAARSPQDGGCRSARVLGRSVSGYVQENEAAWHAVAALSRDGLVGETDAKRMEEILKGLFTTFAAFPDFYLGGLR